MKLKLSFGLNEPNFWTIPANTIRMEIKNIETNHPNFNLTLLYVGGHHSQDRQRMLADIVEIGKFQEGNAGTYFTIDEELINETISIPLNKEPKFTHFLAFYKPDTVPDKNDYFISFDCSFIDEEVEKLNNLLSRLPESEYELRSDILVRIFLEYRGILEKSQLSSPEVKINTEYYFEDFDEIQTYIYKGTKNSLSNAEGLLRDGIEGLKSAIESSKR